jgi:cyd operon protein YbgT
MGISAPFPVEISGNDMRRDAMWYFAWMLGVGLIGCFGILNAMWFELHADDERDWAAVANDY